MLQQTVSSKTALFARLAVLGLTSLVALGAPRALAQTPAPAAGAPAGTAPAAGAPAGKPPWKVACEADIQKHCAEDVKANADVRPCLAKNEATLTQSCKDGFLDKYKVLQLCKGDFDTLCPGMTDGKSLGKCLNEKQAQVSEKCRTAMTRGSKQHKKEEATANPAAAPGAAAVAAKPGKAEKQVKAEKTTKAAGTATP